MQKLKSHAIQVSTADIGSMLLREVWRLHDPAHPPAYHYGISVSQNQDIVSLPLRWVLVNLSRRRQELSSFSLVFHMKNVHLALSQHRNRLYTYLSGYTPPIPNRGGRPFNTYSRRSLMIEVTSHQQ